MHTINTLMFFLPSLVGVIMVTLRHKGNVTMNSLCALQNASASEKMVKWENSIVFFTTPCLIPKPHLPRMKYLTNTPEKWRWTQTACYCLSLVSMEEQRTKN
jgi:hypothetical protein